MRFRQLFHLLAGTSAAAALAAQGSAAPRSASLPAHRSQGAPISRLASQIAIPHSIFRLDNGLTVIVHEDRKAPVVAVSVWYNVGSKDEPTGRTGFAHLFEHLMFYGSDNVREGIMPFLEKIGATDWNGSTWFDRTNYYETVPKSALERTLFMESDRMGYLLPAVDQKRLDLQRGVVQNEKRQDDNQPGGLEQYEVQETLFPGSHPYHHTTIGSMADLDAASLADVKQWFLDRYGPNNAVIALAGDITPSEAKVLMAKYFGPIKRGPVNVPAAASVPTLAAPRSIVMKDHVAATQVDRFWAVPGLSSQDLPALKVGAAILGGLDSSRLRQALVLEDKIAVTARASVLPFQRISILNITATAKPGTDVSQVEKRVDEVTARFLAEGPTADEVRRAATAAMATQIRALEKVGDEGGKAATLASSQLYEGDADFYRKQLQLLASVTPERVREAMRHWLGRPVFNVRIEPGERPPYPEAKAEQAPAGADIPVASVRRDLPPAGPPEALHFPAIERFTLKNGMKVVYARRLETPLTRVKLSFDAGYSADGPGERGLQNMTTRLLTQGTATLDATQVAQQEERLGALVSATGSPDRTDLDLTALTVNLAPSLRLMADMVMDPAFRPGEVERIRGQIVANIQQSKTSPNGMASRALMPLLYGENHPYGTVALGDEAAVKGFSRDRLIAFQQRWLRPDNAELFVVSDLSSTALKPALEQAFGGWQAPSAERGVKNFPATPPQRSAPRIVLIDRPDSPQSVILAGAITPIDVRSDNVPFYAGSYIFGEGVGSRINLDLREAKGWSYGAFGYPQFNLKAVPYLLQAPVQSDRTGESVAELVSQLKDIASTKGVTAEELDQSIANGVGTLPGQFETGDAVLQALKDIELYGRPDDYYEKLAGRYRSLDRAGVDAALRKAIDPAAFTFVVVGDASKVRPQLEKLGLPVEAMPAR